MEESLRVSLRTLRVLAGDVSLAPAPPGPSSILNVLPARVLSIKTVAANRTVAGLLRQRPETTGSTKTIWDGTLTNGRVVDYPARSTTAMPSGSAIIGNWKYLIIAVWGGGIELVVNPYGDMVTGTQNFMKGVVGYRAMLSMDAGAIYPGAFNYAASVT